VSVISLLAQCIVREKWDLYIPLSKSDENFVAAETKNAAVVEKFWFRHDCRYSYENLDTSKLTLMEIFFGNESLRIPGLFPMCLSCVERDVAEGRCLPSTLALLRQYVHFCRGRLDGALMTDASFMRSFITQHSEYKHDSIVTQGIAYDLCNTLVNNYEAVKRNLTVETCEMTNWASCTADCTKEMAPWEAKVSCTTSPGSFLSESELPQKISESDEPPSTWSTVDIVGDVSEFAERCECSFKDPGCPIVTSEDFTKNWISGRCLCEDGVAPLGKLGDSWDTSTRWDDDENDKEAYENFDASNRTVKLDFVSDDESKSYEQIVLFSA